MDCYRLIYFDFSFFRRRHYTAFLAAVTGNPTFPKSQTAQMSRNLTETKAKRQKTFRVNFLYIILYRQLVYIYRRPRIRTVLCAGVKLFTRRVNNIVYGFIVQKKNTRHPVAISYFLLLFSVSTSRVMLTRG